MSDWELRCNVCRFKQPYVEHSEDQQFCKRCKSVNLSISKPGELSTILLHKSVYEIFDGRIPVPLTAFAEKINEVLVREIDLAELRD